MSAPPSAEVVAPLRRALDAVAPIVAEVRDEQWDARTPCERWDVRTLLNHLVGGNLLFVATLTEQPAPDYRADHLGPDPLASYRSSSTRLVDAFSGEGVLDKVFDAPLGQLPGIVMLNLRVTETLVHGWDLAIATGQLPVAPPDVAAQALAFTERLIGGVPREGRFGPQQTVADDAPPLDRLVALLGRDLAAPMSFS